MKYDHPSQKTGVQAIHVCQEQQSVFVFANLFETVSIVSKDPIDGQSVVEIRLDPIHLDRLISALQQVKNEF